MRVIRIVYIVGAAIKLAHRHTDTQTHRQAVRYSGGTLACPSRRDKCPLALCSNDCYLLYWAGGCSPDITIIERTHSLTALSTQYSLRLFRPKEGRNILLIKVLGQHRAGRSQFHPTPGTTPLNLLPFRMEMRIGMMK